MKKLFSLMLLIFCATSNVGHAQGEFCVSPTAIKFPAGQSSTSLTGALVQDEVKCFTFIAKAGQHAAISIRSDGQNAVFQLYQPGWRKGLDDGDPVIKGTAYSGAADGDDAQHWSGLLAGKGRHLITVGTVQGDSSFTLSVAIKP